MLSWRERVAITDVSDAEYVQSSELYPRKYCYHVAVQIKSGVLTEPQPPCPPMIESGPTLCTCPAHPVFQTREYHWPVNKPAQRELVRSCADIVNEEAVFEMLPFTQTLGSRPACRYTITDELFESPSIMNLIDAAKKVGKSMQQWVTCMDPPLATDKYTREWDRSADAVCQPLWELFNRDTDEVTLEQIRDIIDGMPDELTDAEISWCHHSLTKFAVAGGCPVLAIALQNLRSAEQRLHDDCRLHSICSNLIHEVKYEVYCKIKEDLCASACRRKRDLLHRQEERQEASKRTKH